MNNKKYERAVISTTYVNIQLSTDATIIYDGFLRVNGLVTIFSVKILTHELSDALRRNRDEMRMGVV